MECAPLTWCSCPPSNLGLLDKVQRQALWLLDLYTRLHETPSLLQPLQHRRDVSGMCVMYKIQRQHTPPVATLQPPTAAPTIHATRSSWRRNQQVQVPFARTELFLRSFQSRYSRLWNNMVDQSDIHYTKSMEQFRKNINRWLFPPWSTKKSSLTQCYVKVLIIKYYNVNLPP